MIGRPVHAWGIDGFLGLALLASVPLRADFLLLCFSSVLDKDCFFRFIPAYSYMSPVETEGLSVTHSSHRTGCPDLRLLHYNDVYHVEYAPGC